MVWATATVAVLLPANSAALPAVSAHAVEEAQMAAVASNCGSNDELMLHSLAQPPPHLARVLHRRRQRGKGFGVQLGCLAARQTLQVVVVVGRGREMLGLRPTMP